MDSARRIAIEKTPTKKRSAQAQTPFAPHLLAPRSTSFYAPTPPLKVGQADDPLEREADRAADAVMAAPEGSISAQSVTRAGPPR